MSLTQSAMKSRGKIGATTSRTTTTRPRRMTPTVSPSLRRVCGGTSRARESSGSSVKESMTRTQRQWRHRLQRNKVAEHVSTTLVSSLTALKSLCNLVVVVVVDVVVDVVVKGNKSQRFGVMGLIELIQTYQLPTIIIFSALAVYQKNRFRTHSHRKSMDYTVLVLLLLLLLLSFSFLSC